MIKQINKADELLSLVLPGSISATNNNADCGNVPFAGNLIGILASVGVAGVLGAGGTVDLVIDILKNGVSIYGTTKLDFATTSVVPVYVAPAVDPLALAAGDVLTLKVVSIYNGAGPTQAIDLCVSIQVRRSKQSPPAASAQGGVDAV